VTIVYQLALVPLIFGLKMWHVDLAMESGSQGNCSLMIINHALISCPPNIHCVAHQGN
jgi:hypothetical protein